MKILPHKLRSLIFEQVGTLRNRGGLIPSTGKGPIWSLTLQGLESRPPTPLRPHSGSEPAGRERAWRSDMH